MQRENLILISKRRDHFAEAYNRLCHSNINVVQAENAYTVKVGLIVHSPTFILLDFDITGAEFLLRELVTGQRLSQPYIMVAADYADGNDRAEMLRLGADICIDWPINVGEVLAVIHAVRRRRRRIPVIEYEELSIHTTSR